MTAVTAFQALAAGLVTVLTASPAIASGNVKANPTRPWPETVQQAVALRLSRADRVSGDACGDHWQVVIELDCAARATTGTDPGDAVDALLSAVADRIAAADLTLLGVIERDPQASIQWTFDATDRPAASATLALGFTVHTVTNRLVQTNPYSLTTDTDSITADTTAYTSDQTND